VAALGAELVIDYRNEDFADLVLRHTGKRGVDVILDHIGGPYLAGNVKALAVGGRLALIGVMGGRKGELDMGRVLVQRLTIVGSVLRPRSVAEKGAIIRQFEQTVMPLIASRAIVPLIHRVYPLEDVAAAHRAMEAGEHFGKLVLAVNHGEGS
jgi:NADPH:quinone reductase-like Zn-dependent oxidoreductase